MSATVLTQGTDDASEFRDGTSYEYAFGLINYGEDESLGAAQVPSGGDVRLMLNGWFPNKVTRSAEPPVPNNATFYIEPLYDGQAEINNLNPAKLQSGPFESIEISIGYGVGPFSVGGLKWDIDQQDPTVDENYQGNTEHTYWEMTTNRWATSQDNAYGASCDFEVDGTVNSGENITLYARSNFTYYYTPTLSGSPIYITTDDIDLYQTFYTV